MRTRRHTGFFLANTLWRAALACLLASAGLPCAGQTAGQGADRGADQGASRTTSEVASKAASETAAETTPAAPAAATPAASAPTLMRWSDGLYPGTQQGMTADLVVEPPEPAPAAAPAPAPITLWPSTDAADALPFIAPPSPPPVAAPATAPTGLQPPDAAPASARPLPAQAAPGERAAVPVELAPGQARLSAPSRPALGLHSTQGKALGSGVASWYGPGFHGRLTANGERFDMNAMTAAHKTLPFGTRVLVHNPRTGKQVVVRINDRGPFAKGRVIDLSRAAASALGLKARGHDKVVLHELPREGASSSPAVSQTAGKPANPKANPKANATANSKGQTAKTAKPSNAKARAQAKTPPRPAKATKPGTAKNQKR